MNVAYVEYAKNVEALILKSYLNSGGSVVTIGKSSLVMPMILNVTPEDLPELKQLGHSIYKWVHEFRTMREPTEAALDRFGFRIQRIVSAAKKHGMDILVVYDPKENIDLIRDELKKWIRTK